MATSGPTPVATALPAGEKVYLVNHGPVGSDPSISIYSVKAGTVSGTPLATIAGADTMIAQPFFDAVDAKGTLYVSNQSDAPGNATSGYVTEYDATSQSGNVVPSRVITGLDDPEGLAIDASGQLYVGETNEIAVFAPGAAGNASPVRVISGANTDIDGLSFNGQVHGLAVDASGDLFASLSASVLEFAPGANGNATPTNIFGATSDGALYGSATLASCLGTAVDSAGNVYCANFNNSTFTVFQSAASPGLVVASTAKQPVGIYVDAAGTIFAANYNSSSLTVFSSMTSFLAGTPTQTIAGTAASISYPYGVTAR